MIKGHKTLYIKNPASLNFSLGTLIIRTVNETTRIHLGDISNIVIESCQVNLSTYLLKELSERNIELIFCNEKHLPVGQIVPLHGNYESAKKLKLQVNFSSDTKIKVWQEILKQKIQNQQKTLEKLKLKYDSKLFESAINDVEQNEQHLIEAKVASHYFDCLFGKKFTRNTGISQINSYLNYGYAILLSNVCRYIVALGYKTELGLFHRGDENQNNLASDLMEPFRPIFDYFLYSKFDLGNIETKKSIDQEANFLEDKQEIPNIINEKIIIRNSEQFLNNAIEMYVQSVFASLVENDLTYLIFPDKY